MSLLIRYAHIPFYFHFSFAFSTSLIHHYAPPLRCDCTTITLASLDQSCLFDGHMIYDSHVFTSILSISNVPPLAVWPITSSHTARSGTFYNFALCSLSCFPFVFKLPVFTFHKEDHQKSFPQNSDLSSSRLIVLPRSVLHLRSISHSRHTSLYRTILNLHLTPLHTPWYYVRRPFHCSWIAPF